MAEALWRTMNEGGFSPILRSHILKFNGGLFESTKVLPLNRDQLGLLFEAADSRWRDVEPAIFGTLLERALDPDERHALGAHYTPRLCRAARHSHAGRAYPRRLAQRPCRHHPAGQCGQPSTWHVRGAEAVFAGKRTHSGCSLHEGLVRQDPLACYSPLQPDWPRHSGCLVLANQHDCELGYAFFGHCGGDGSEGCCAEGAVRLGEGRGVGYIEQFGAELQLRTFAESGALDE